MDTAEQTGPTKEQVANELAPTQDAAWIHALKRVGLAKAALPDSRPLEDWERQAADDFFWSHF
jgi:hypothetical protein